MGIDLFEGMDNLTYIKNLWSSLEFVDTNSHNTQAQSLSRS